MNQACSQVDKVWQRSLHPLHSCWPLLFPTISPLCILTCNCSVFVLYCDYAVILVDILNYRKSLWILFLLQVKRSKLQLHLLWVWLTNIQYFLQMLRHVLSMVHKDNMVYLIQSGEAFSKMPNQLSDSLYSITHPSKAQSATWKYNAHNHMVLTAEYPPHVHQPGPHNVWSTSAGSKVQANQHFARCDWPLMAVVITIFIRELG